jgi:3-dehydroquinate synthase
MEDSSVSDTLTVQSHKHTYDVRFKEDFAAQLQKDIREGDHIICDANIHRLYGEKLQPVLDTVQHTILAPSEAQKSYQGLAPVISRLIESGFRKNNRLIAIGGGITQDVTAFTASIMFRGTGWIFYPTTLLAQCDSCIGSKTSINFGAYKNQLGGFYPPVSIVIDLAFMDTLPELDFRSGMGEMIHYYLVSGEEDFERMQREYDAAFEDRGMLRGLIYHSLDFKRGYVERDEFDKGPRNVFNYGHSFGHAIETITEYRVPHGIAVSFGMDIANYLSMKLGYITPELRERVRGLLLKNIGDMEIGEVTVDALLGALRKDKKNVGAEIRVILTRGPGAMFKTPLEVNDDVRQWLSEVLASFDGGKE